MTPRQLTPKFQRFCRLAEMPAGEQRTDAQLLRAFAQDRDEDAFAAIVRRHSALVLGVCRRTLAHHQDAEDASQATFLVLAQQAASIRRDNSLAAWLHGVAFRVAMKAKRSRKQSSSVPTACALARPTPDELTWREVLAVLDEEVQRLPEAYRRVFVECCLNERSKPEVARALGLKEGTVSSRLARARQQIQERLARRGVTLSAVLTVAGLGQAGRASAATVRATARAAVQLVAGDSPTGIVPAQVLSIARGVTRAMLYTKARVTAFLILFATLLTAGAWGLLGPAAAQPPPKAGVPKTPTLVVNKAPGGVRGTRGDKAQGEQVQVRGRVLGPEGRPIKGAKLFLAVRWDEAQQGRRPIAATDGDGKFEAAVARADLERDVVLVATAAGLAPDWIAARDVKKGDVTLRPVKEGSGIRGRLLDLEGRPLANITVNVHWVGKKPGGEEDVGKWVNGFVEMARKGYWDNAGNVLLARPRALGVTPSVTTDKAGRFTLTGLGCGRVATIFLRSEKTAIVRLQVAAWPGPEDGWVRGQHGLYPERFKFLLAPCKPIVGTVRDKKTGKPIADVKVATGNWIDECTTDAEGRFRIIGSPKLQSGYVIALGGRKGVPYIDYTQHDIADTPGLEPLRVDFELERGVEISGKILDQATGKPVRGSVMYFYTRDNPFTKNYTTLGGARLIVSDWGKIGPDGSFTVLGIPGPGVLVVLAADSARYPRFDSRQELWKLGVNGWPAAPAQLAVKVDPREDNPKSLTCGVLTLTPGATKQGIVADADGKPLEGARVVGLTDSDRPQKLEGSTFAATGLEPKRQRALVFFHEGKKLGAVIGVDDAGANAFTVKLRPLGSLKGRLVDSDGKPMANLKVLVRLSLDDKRYLNLPEEYGRLSGAFNIVPGAWRNFTGREATTDKDGRFRIEGIIPGETYNLYAGPGNIEYRGGVSHRALKLTITADQEKELGDLAPKEQAVP
jgi:RNA polymerase sigma factor (sigma-70 family)